MGVGKDRQREHARELRGAGEGKGDAGRTRVYSSVDAGYAGVGGGAGGGGVSPMTVVSGQIGQVEPVDPGFGLDERVNKGDMRAGGGNSGASGNGGNGGIGGNGGKSGERKKWKLEEIERWTMVKRIW